MGEYARDLVNTVENIEVYFDGIAIENISKYRLSTDLFYFTGNPVLAECYDDCITGEPQPGLVDGYFMMLKKLKKGRHSVILKGEVPSQDFTYSATINLNVI